MPGTRKLLAPLASAAVAAAVAAVAAGCGGGTGNSGSSSSATSSAVEPTMVTSTEVQPPTPSTPGPTAPSGSPSTSAPPPTEGKATLTGTAVRGAEPGCVGLEASDGHSYELAGDAPRKLARNGGGGYQAKLGKVRVTGYFASGGTASHCMMGRIFVVNELEKLR